MEGSQKPLAVITGASSGIGYELAKVFGEEGFDLPIAAENPDLAEAEENLKATGAEVQAHRVDLATEAGVVERDRGRILFTSSIASTMPGAFQAVYQRLEVLRPVLCSGDPQRAEGHRRDDHLADAGPD